MIRSLATPCALRTVGSAIPKSAQERVVRVPNVEALFTSLDPKRHWGKRAAYHLERDLLASGPGKMADQWPSTQ